MRAKTFGFSLNDRLHAKLMLLGGGRWLRNQIENAALKPVVGWPWSDRDARDRAICEDLRPASQVAADYNLNRKTVYSIRDKGKLQGWVVHEFEKQTPLKSRRKKP